jgi:ketosteroid isomerase-like protein
MANSTDYIAIQNVLARYCFALDTKDLNQLHQVLTPDIDAQYPFPGGDMQGIEAVISVISKRLHAITSQHALTTQAITILPSGNRAHATTYFSGVHFGQDEWAGQTCTAYGKYVDELVLLEESGSESKGEGDEGKEEVLAGASGRWRVCKRKVEFMARIGEEGIFKR